MVRIHPAPPMKIIVRGSVWKWPSGEWHFVYVDGEVSKKIKAKKLKKIGFSFIPIKAKLGKSEWKTALFPTKEGPYMISIKKSVRKAEGVYDGDLVRVVCETL